MKELFEDRKYALSALEVKNVKGVRAVALKFDPEKDIFVIGGENEAGKTSTIDALWYALAGARNHPEKPIREGERKAEVTVTLNDKETGKPHLKAVRKWWYSKKGQLRTKLELTDPNGVEVPGGAQTILDRLYSHLLDPTEFLNYDRQKKVEAVRELVGVDFSELDAERKTVYAQRTEANRKREDLLARFEGAEEYPEAEGKTFDDVPDVSSLLEKQEEYAKAVQQRTDLYRKVQDADERSERLQGQLDLELKEIERIKERLREAEKTAEETRERITQAQKDSIEFGKQHDVIKVPEVGDVKQAIAEAESLKEKIRANKVRDKIGKELDAADAEATKYDDRIHEIDEEKAKRLKEADFPIEGMSFDDEDVYFNGKPLHQCSTSEQIRVSLAMALANPPKLPVMFIRRSESLDAKRLKMIADTAHKAGALVIAERVSTGPECDVIIEDGRVRAGDEPDEPEEPKELPVDKQAKKDAGVYDL